MSLTAEQIQNCKALVTSIWGAGVANNLDYNEEVVAVVGTAVKEIGTCSARLADLFRALVIATGAGAALIYSRMWILEGAQKIADTLDDMKQGNLQARACIATAAANYRSPLEMASLGL